MSDVIEINLHNTHATALICEPFWEQSALVAHSRGQPGMARVQLNYPLAGTGVANIAAEARAATGRIMRSLGWS